MPRKPYRTVVIQCDGYPDEEIALTKKQFDKIEKARKLLNMSFEEFLNFAIVDGLNDLEECAGESHK
jgi:hypothetical protein